MQSGSETTNQQTQIDPSETILTESPATVPSDVLPNTASALDASPPDASPPSASQPEASQPHASPPSASPPEATQPDAPPPSASPPNAFQPDVSIDENLDDIPFDLSTPTGRDRQPRDLAYAPIRSPNRVQYPMRAKLGKRELFGIIRDAPKGKASGTDDITYDILKMCNAVLSPYLAMVYNAFLFLKIQPDMFKEAVILAVLKPSKDPAFPASYRPITLLNVLAKIYERIVTTRITQLVKQYGLLPTTQFGSPGSSTVHALEYIINFIHTSWMNNRVVTLFSLDLSGAYDHVVRKLLLQCLVDVGLPDWIVDYIWSWLSWRRAFVCLPGKLKREEIEYFVRVGIPQGSPLSSILFLFYSAIFLDKAHRVGFSPSALCVSMYVDDTTVLVSSVSRKQIMAIFERFFTKTAKTLDDRNFHFSPTKYGVLNLEAPGHKHKQKESPQMLPNLEQFKNLSQKDIDRICPDSLRILGIQIDRELSFIPHLERMETQIRIDISVFLKFNNCVRGRSLDEGMELYETKLWPRISYAAAAWFIYSDDLVPKHS